MSTLASNLLTLEDWAKRLDPSGQVPTIVELLAQNNEVLPDMLWKEGNLPTGHRTTVRTGLPTVAWRLLNQGVQPSKSRTAQIDEACGKLEAWSEVDKDLAELNGNLAAFRLSEAMAFIEAMNQQMASTLFYGNSSINPEQFTGLAARYSSLSAANAENIVSGAGSGNDQTSIWLICWGEQSIHGIFPKGTQAGIVRKDMGLQVIQTSTSLGGTRMLGYQEMFQWNCGIALRDWRYVVRIANIDVTNLVAESSAADLVKLMIKAVHRLPSRTAGRCAFYMNRTVYEFLDIQNRGDVRTGGQLNYDKVAGVDPAPFRGIPLRKVDALLETESAVS